MSYNVFDIYFITIVLIVAVLWFVKTYLNTSRIGFFRNQEQKIQDSEEISSTLGKIVMDFGAFRAFIFKCFGDPDPKYGNDWFLKILFQQGYTEGMLPKYDWRTLDHVYLGMIAKTAKDGINAFYIEDLPECLTKRLYKELNVDYAVMYYLQGDSHNIIYSSISFKRAQDFFDNKDDIMKMFKRLGKLYKK